MMKYVNKFCYELMMAHNKPTTSERIDSLFVNITLMLTAFFWLDLVIVSVHCMPALGALLTTCCVCAVINALLLTFFYNKRREVKSMIILSVLGPASLIGKLITELIVFRIEAYLKYKMRNIILGKTS